MAFRTKVSDLDVAISALYTRMQTTDPDDPEYAKLVSHVKELESIKSGKHSNRPSNDTMWIVLGGIAQVVIIVAYENSHVLVSKATNFILKHKL